jgi:hypothetical protein
MARKHASRPVPLFPDLDPVAELLRTVPQTTDERLAHIRALGARVAKYVRGVRATAPPNGASAEAREKAVAIFYEHLADLERQLSRIYEEFQLV